MSDDERHLDDERPDGRGPDDERHLAECIELAARARGDTSPNPMVGAVVVATDGEVLARAWHRRPGEPHAEVLALREAGSRAAGATLYTNMEPCCHQGRTPPCVRDIVAAGVARVVASIPDPDPRVRGRGFAALRGAGIEVATGVLAEEATLANEGYLTFKQHGRPFVLAKAALSLDGRLGTRAGQSQWITGPEARRHAHRARRAADAVLVGVGTVLSDDPRLTARIEGEETETAAHHPGYRVVLDSRARTPTDAGLLTGAGGAVLVLTTGQAPPDRVEGLRRAGAEVAVVEADEAGRPGWPAVLRELAARDVTYVMVEGGGEILTSALQAGIIDKLLLLFAPILIGGKDAPCLWAGDGVDSLHEAPRLQRIRRFEVGADLAVEGYLRLPVPPDPDIGRAPRGDVSG